MAARAGAGDPRRCAVAGAGGKKLILAVRLQFDELYRDWSCETCTPELRAWRGHSGPPAQGDYLIPLLPGREAMRLDRCPLLAITRETVGWLTIYPDYDRGVLPRAGGLYDQPARWYHAMKVIASAVGQCERERMEEMEPERTSSRGPSAARGRSEHWTQWAKGTQGRHGG